MDTPNTRQKLIPAGTLFKESWSKYKRRFTDLAWIVLPAALLAAVGSYLARFGGLIGGLGGLISLAGVVAGILSTIASVYAVRHEKQFDESYSYAVKNFFSYVWVAVLMFLAELGGLFMGVVPAFIFAIWFSLVCYIFVSEGDRGLSALLKSKEYVRGYFWPVVGRLLVTLVASILVAAAAGIISAILGSIGTALAGILSQIVLGPFLVVYLYSIYQDLARVKPELVGTKPDKNRSFFVFACIWGIAASIIFVSVLAIAMGPALVEALKAGKW